MPRRKSFGILSKSIEIDKIYNICDKIIKEDKARNYNEANEKMMALANLLLGAAEKINTLKRKKTIEFTEGDSKDYVDSLKILHEKSQGFYIMTFSKIKTIKPTFLESRKDFLDQVKLILIRFNEIAEKNITINMGQVGSKVPSDPRYKNDRFTHVSDSPEFKKMEQISFRKKKSDSPGFGPKVINVDRQFAKLLSFGTKPPYKEFIMSLGRLILIIREILRFYEKEIDPWDAVKLQELTLGLNYKCLDPKTMEILPSYKKTLSEGQKVASKVFNKYMNKRIR